MVHWSVFLGKVLFIAEAGVNHNGSIELAKKMIDSAAFAGADFIKFQHFSSHKLVCPNTPKADYQNKYDFCEDNQNDMLKRLELSFSQHQELHDYCVRSGICYICTPFDCESAIEIKELVPFYKVSSGDLNNFPLLKILVEIEKPIVISTGMANMEEVQLSVDFIRSELKKKNLCPNDMVQIGKVKIPRLTALHCTTAYPTKPEDVNLKAIDQMRSKLNISIGHSDHTLGIEIPLAACALGACIIEKHFTLDQKMEGPDHKASLPAKDLTKLIKGIQKVNLSLGDGEKRPKEIEIENAKVVRKGLYYAQNLSKGHRLKEEDIKVLRPKAELGPELFFNILGKELKKDVSNFSKVSKEDF